MSRILRSPYTLVVCEKPDAARRIAQALCTSHLESIPEVVIQSPDAGERRAKAVTPIYCVTGRNDNQFVICSALGHLYGLADPKGKRSEYPIFNVVWRPVPTKKVLGSKTQKYPSKQELVIRTISLLSHKATRFIHACDYATIQHK